MQPVSHNPFLKRRWVRCLLVAISAFFLYVFGSSWWKEHQLQLELSRLRAIRVPTSAQELNNFYKISVGNPDATAAWMKPISALSSGAIGRHPHGFVVLDKHGSWPSLPGSDWSKLESAEQFIADHKQLFQDIDTAVATPGNCCFIRDFSTGATLLLPHAQESRTITRLLALRAFVSAHRGNFNSVLSDINAMFTTANTLAREPVTVTQLCRNANVRIALLTLEQLLPFLSANESSLAALQHRIAAIRLHDNLRLMVVGDRVLGLTSFKNPATAGAGRTPAMLYRAWVRDHPLDLLQAMRSLDDRFMEDWPAPLTIAVPYRDKLWQDSEAKSPWGGQTWHSPTKYAKTITSHIISVANDEARARAATAAIAAVRFRQQQNRWPNAPNELIPAYLAKVPLDPFDGEPLKFVVSETEIRVYSVGSNLEDDGGKEETEDEKHGSYRRGNPDVLFRLRLQPASK